MIYIDTSVVLSLVFSERVQPHPSFWRQRFIASGLLEYEVFNRVNAREVTDHQMSQVRQIIDQITTLDMSPEILVRALQPFPIAVRTLDALHLATMVYLRSRGQEIHLASYDRRFVEAAKALGFAEADGL